MKKLAIMMLMAASAFTFTACSAPESTPKGETSKHVTYEDVVVNGEHFGCTFEKRGYTTGSMSCVELPSNNTPSRENNTKGFTSDVLTVNGKEQYCIFENRGYTTGNMDCFPMIPST